MAENNQETNLENSVEASEEMEVVGQAAQKKKKDGRKFWQKIAAVCLVGGLLFGFLFGTVFGFGVNKIINGFEKARQTQREKSGEYYQVAQEVTLGKYKGLNISLIPTEEDIQNEIDSVIEQYTTYEKKKGTARDGDKVYAEFEGSVNGVKMDELRGSDYVDIGSQEWLEEFETAFIGMKTGKTKKISVKMPKGAFGNDSIDGKTVKFTLKLKYICGDAIEPEYDDEFVQSISDYETVAEYTEYLVQELTDTAEEERAEYAWSEVVEASDIKNYPEDMVAAAKEEVLQGYYDMADMQGYNHDEIFQDFGYADEEDFVDTELEELAQDTVKEVMVAQAIANKEGISYTEEDYQTLLKDEYENNQYSYDSQEAYEEGNETYLKNTALIEKVKAWIDENTNYERDEE